MKKFYTTLFLLMGLGVFAQSKAQDYLDTPLFSDSLNFSLSEDKIPFDSLLKAGKSFRIGSRQTGSVWQLTKEYIDPNMPMIKLNEGYNGTLLVKKVPKDYPSRMPEIDYSDKLGNVIITPKKKKK